MEMEEPNTSTIEDKRWILPSRVAKGTITVLLGQAGVTTAEGLSPAAQRAIAQNELKSAKEENDKINGSLRKLAGHIKEALRNGTSQQEVAKYLDRSQSWVSQIVAWHERGAVGFPFGTQSK